MQRALRLELIISLRRFSSSTMLYFYEWVVGQFYVQKDQLFLWVPIFFAIGIGVYFLVPSEPPLALGLIFWGLSICLHIFSRGGWRYLFFCMVLMCSGFLASSLRTVSVHTFVIENDIKFADVNGRIISIEPMEDGGGSRIVLSDLNIDKLDSENAPRNIRLRLRQDESVRVGQRIKVLASLTAPSSPFVPGGFDFRRYMYFQGIGAVGFIYKTPEILEDAPARFKVIEQWRGFISERIRQSLEPRQASVALALIVGQKNALADEDQQALRDSGLAHMLAISGLHVGLVSGTLFFVLRFLLALIPFIALHYPIKKIAAVFAFTGAVFYMLLAGMTVPTQRAVFMIGIVFLAIILDRSPISLRLVALSALLVLLFKPESLLSASFHMSFAAVTCLVYFYDVTRNFWSHNYTNSNWARRIMLYFLAVFVTTLIASLATAPFALYHFGQVSFMGSVANLTMVPLFAFLIMPFALLGTLFVFMGLEYWPLQIVGVGIDMMLEVAYWAADLPYAILKGAAWSFASFLLLISASLWVILWKGYGKILAFFPLFFSFQVSASHFLPDFLLSPSHDLFGFYDNRRIFVSTKRREKFIIERWETYYGIEEGGSVAMTYKGADENYYQAFKCGEEGCRFNVRGRKISFVRTPYALKEDCAWADVLISVYPVDKTSCGSAHIVDKFDTWRSGAHAIWILDHNDVHIEDASDYIGNRSWSVYHQRDR